MKKISSLLLSLILMLMTTILVGCHEHVFNEATCTEPATCIECGEVQGEALGHDWAGATCESPDTCTRCGETRGEALGHDWVEATCESPDTCTHCGETRGEALGHTVKVGRCDRCQKKQNKELIWQIYHYFDLAMFNRRKALENIGEASAAMKFDGLVRVDDQDVALIMRDGYLSLAEICNEDTRSYLEDIYVLCDMYVSCGDYSELNSVKLSAKEAMVNMPKTITSTGDAKYFESGSKYTDSLECLATEIAKYTEAVQEVYPGWINTEN